MYWSSLAPAIRPIPPGDALKHDGLQMRSSSYVRECGTKTRSATQHAIDKCRSALHSAPNWHLLASSWTTTRLAASKEQ
jgi:hypothetical protein